MPYLRIQGKTQNCTCSAYKFPHRKNGGNCIGYDDEYCSCRAPIATYLDVSPPEVVTNKHCPIHGQWRDL